jgi:hypothetical protein
VRDNLFLEGGKNSVLLLEGWHAMPARPSGEAILECRGFGTLFNDDFSEARLYSVKDRISEQ